MSLVLYEFYFAIYYALFCVHIPNDSISNIDSDLNFFNHLEQTTNKFTVEEFRETCRENTIDCSYLKFIGFDIRSNFVHINGFLSISQPSEYLPDVCVLVETWLSNENRDAAIQLKGRMIFM